MTDRHVPVASSIGVPRGSSNVPSIRTLAAGILLFAGMIGVPAAIAWQLTGFSSSFFGPLLPNVVRCGLVAALTLSCCVPAVWLLRGTAHERAVLRGAMSIAASITALVAIAFVVFRVLYRDGDLGPYVHAQSMNGWYVARSTPGHVQVLLEVAVAQGVAGAALAVGALSLAARMGRPGGERAARLPLVVAALAACEVAFLLWQGS